MSHILNALKKRSQCHYSHDRCVQSKNGRNLFCCLVFCALLNLKPAFAFTMQVSKNAILPSFSTSFVNFMLGCTLFNCSSFVCKLLSFGTTAKTSSTYGCQIDSRPIIFKKWASSRLLHKKTCSHGAQW